MSAVTRRDMLSLSAAGLTFATAAGLPPVIAQAMAAPGPAFLNVPLDPAADAPLFSLFAEWCQLNRDIDGATDGIAETLCDRTTALVDAMIATPALTVPGLAIKLRLGWAKRLESWPHEKDLIDGPGTLPLPWDDKGKWMKPEFDPEWSFIRDIARLLGVLVEEPERLAQGVAMRTAT